MTDSQFIPDFSGDDFANDKGIQKTRAAVKAYEELIEDSLSLIRQKLNVQDIVPFDYKAFHMFSSLSATITHSMQSVTPDNAICVSLARYFSAFPTAKSSNSGSDQYLFGHILFRNNYPRTYIHKETVKEKIEDVFLKRDVDFSDCKEFSRKFQVLTEDENRLRNLLQLRNLDDLTPFADLELEFSGNAVLFRNSRKPVSMEEANVFCDLAKVLLTVFN